MKIILPVLIGLVVILSAVYFYFAKYSTVSPKSAVNNLASDIISNPLAIDTMRKGNYPGSDIQIEKELADGTNYKQYIASYKSEGLKIYALLTVPKGTKPDLGFPVIVFNHGYIPPDQYKTTERYVAYVAYFARNGYVVFKPDYRGHGQSEGDPLGAYYSSAYAIDVLNAVSSVKNYKDVNGSKIGMWGHSMGGNITLRDLEVSLDVKAAVIWGGVVGSYDDLVNNWHRRVPFVPSARELSLRNRFRQDLIDKYGNPSSGGDFWKAVDPTLNLNFVNTPIQLHHGLADEEVPFEFSVNLDKKLKDAGKTVELFTYAGADHNISSPAFELAMKRSLDFFDKYLK